MSAAVYIVSSRRRACPSSRLSPLASSSCPPPSRAALRGMAAQLACPHGWHAAPIAATATTAGAWSVHPQIGGCAAACLALTARAGLLCDFEYRPSDGRCRAIIGDNATATWRADAPPAADAIAYQVSCVRAAAHPMAARALAVGSVGDPVGAFVCDELHPTCARDMQHFPDVFESLSRPGDVEKRQRSCTRFFSNPQPKSHGKFQARGWAAPPPSSSSQGGLAPPSPVSLLSPFTPPPPPPLALALAAAHPKERRHRHRALPAHRLFRAPGEPLGPARPHLPPPYSSAVAFSLPNARPIGRP